MALCDRLEAARAEREATRDRLAAASLARLNAPDPETFQDDARFALDALPALTTRPDQIKQLRQTILNLAVRGKTRAAGRRDEDGLGFDLVAEIRTQLQEAEKRAARASQLKGQQHLIAIRPFDVPQTWGWITDFTCSVN